MQDESAVLAMHGVEVVAEERAGRAFEAHLVGAEDGLQQAQGKSPTPTTMMITAEEAAAGPFSVMSPKPVIEASVIVKSSAST